MRAEQRLRMRAGENDGAESLGSPFVNAVHARHYTSAHPYPNIRGALNVLRAAPATMRKHDQDRGAAIRAPVFPYLRLGSRFIRPAPSAQSRRLTQCLRQARVFPRQGDVVAAKVTVSRGLAIDRSPQIEVAYNRTGAQVEVASISRTILSSLMRPVPKVSTLMLRGCATPIA